MTAQGSHHLKNDVVAHLIIPFEIQFFEKKHAKPGVSLTCDFTTHFKVLLLM